MNVSDGLLTFLYVHKTLLKSVCAFSCYYVRKVKCQRFFNNIVNSFCILGDILNEDGGTDLADTARIRNGWMTFREFLPFLTPRASP